MIKACVIGWPISHSRSPLIHNYWLRKYQIDGSYTRQPVEPNALAEFIRTLRSSGYAGCNCTIPHKEAVYGLIPAADDYTRKVGAINTVFAIGDAFLGTNTDGEGFLANIASAVDVSELRNKRIVILGAGGASVAIAGFLQDQGFANLAVVNRTVERVTAMRARLGGRIEAIDWNDRSFALSECGLLVNTTSLGMQGQPPLDISLDRLPDDAVVTDIVYTPLRTQLLKDAAARGNRVVEGLGMLVRQAVRGFTLWFGKTPEVTAELFDLVALDIDPNYRR
jgi:shikimate dehydrogenase